MKRMHHPCRREGFTLVEVAIATVILAIGVCGLLLACASSSSINLAGQEMTQAVFLAQEYREYTAGRDPNALSAATYCPPRDSQLNEISHMKGWTQQISLDWLDPNGLVEDPNDTKHACRRVSVKILHGDRAVLETGWLVSLE